MAKDVLITPLDGIIQFSSSAGTGSGQIKVDGDDLVISNLIGDVLLGDGASDVFIGNGSDNVDIVFEQNGEIRDDGSGKTITLGSKTTTLILSSSSDITMQGGGGKVGIGTSNPTKELQVAGDISASGDASIGTAVNHSAVNAYGTLQVNQDADNDESGIGIQNRLNGRSLRIYVDSSNNSVLNSGDGGGQPLILNEGAGKVGIGTTTLPSVLTVDGDMKATHITASGDISGSGLLIVSQSGIGLASPETVFHIQQPAGTTPELRVEGLGNTNSKLMLKNSQGNWEIFREFTSKNLVFKNNGGDIPLILNQSHITASGNISSSGTITAEHIVSSDDMEVTDDLSVGGVLSVAGDIQHVGDTDTKIVFGTDSITLRAGATELFKVTEASPDTISFGAAISSHITASGNISASGGTFTGNFPDTNDNAEHPVLVTSAQNGTIESQNSLKVNPSTSQTSVLGNLNTSGTGSLGQLEVATSTLTSSIEPLKGTFNIHYGTNAQFTGSLDNGTGYGEIMSNFPVHTELDKGEICYLINQVWRKADADGEASTTKMLGVTLAKGMSSGGQPVLIRGVARLKHNYINDAPGGGNEGDLVYLSNSDGQVQYAAPSDSGEFVRIVGYCLNEDDDIIYFDPDKSFVEVA